MLHASTLPRAAHACHPTPQRRPDRRGLPCGAGAAGLGRGDAGDAQCFPVAGADLLPAAHAAAPHPAGQTGGHRAALGAQLRRAVLRGRQSLDPHDAAAAPARHRAHQRAARPRAAPARRTVPLGLLQRLDEAAGLQVHHRQHAAVRRRHRRQHHAAARARAEDLQRRRGARLRGAEPAHDACAADVDPARQQRILRRAHRCAGRAGAASGHRRCAAPAAACQRGDGSAVAPRAWPAAAPGPAAGRAGRGAAAAGCVHRGAGGGLATCACPAAKTPT